MGRRCGCAGTCGCVYRAGRGAGLSGSGSKSDPIRVDIVNGQAYMLGEASATMAVNVSGSGNSNSPYLVTMDLFAGVAVPVVVSFTTPGSYEFTKPSFGSFVRLYMCGGGGGGAGGDSPAGFANMTLVQNDLSLALGGVRGDRVELEQRLANLGATVPVVVGAGGAGGLGRGASASTAGGPGSTSSFGNVTARGGSGGQKGTPGGDTLRTNPPLTGGPDADTDGRGGRGGAAGYSASSIAAAQQVQVGGPGAAPNGQFPFGGAGGSTPYQGGVGEANPAMSLAVYGTGGGGGRGTLAWYGATVVSSGTPGAGGAGGPGAGGGGGGLGLYLGGPGGAGGSGVVTVLIQ